MIEIYYEALLKRVRETLQSGRSVAVVGWRDSNHSELTRQLSQDKKKKVIFFSASKSRLPERIGLVLFTPFVYHSESERLRKGKLYHPIPIETGQIKKILESCKDLLVFSPSNPIVSGREKPIVVELVAMPSQIDKMDDKVLDFLTTPSKEKREMSSIEKFVKDFLIAAEANSMKPGHVGKTVLAKMRRECGVEKTPPQLVSAGWIIGEKGGDKKKVGSYRAGPKMVAANAAEGIEPEDGYELAKYLVAQKDDVLAEKVKIEEKLARIKMAEEVLEALAALK